MFEKTSKPGSSAKSSAQKWTVGGAGLALFATLLNRIGIVDIPQDILQGGYYFIGFVVAFFIRRAV